ncbi:MAG: tRNA pseudouridine(55) synthase TruB [Thermoleophilia bacterium]|nr:tRNA pseudouridine(55) synthase TruB [Thermoleophilia bacterium]
MPPRALRPAGLVLADKPPGPSSFAVVREHRDRTGARAGHAGTLDPFASGLLLVLLGAATRLARYLVGLDKRYLTEVDLTARTATGDCEGAMVERREPLPAAELERALQRLRGEVELRVPAASAVKVGGERAYRLARRGVEVEMPLRRSTVHALELVAYDGRVARLDLRVSSGTYVRALADALGGHCRTLRRTEVGPFHVAYADPKQVLPPAAALPFLPTVEVGEEGARALRAGRPVSSPARPVPGTGDGPGGPLRVRALDRGDLVAVVRAERERLVPETVLPA